MAGMVKTRRLQRQFACAATWGSLRLGRIFILERLRRALETIIPESSSARQTVQRIQTVMGITSSLVSVA